MPQSKPLSTASDKFLLSPDKPSWDTSPISRGPWYFSLEDYLPTVDGRFSTLLRKGYVLTKGKVCVSSVQHLAIVKMSLDNRQFSFETPSPVDPLDSLTTYDATEAAKVDAIVASITDEDYKRFTLAPELIQEVDQELLSAITSTIIGDRDTVNAIESKAHFSGRAALINLRTSVEDIAVKHGSAIEAMMHALLDHGITSKSLRDFNVFKRSLIIWNKCMGKRKRLPDSILSDKLVSAVNDLGDRIDIVLTVKITAKDCAGDLEACIECVKDVLADTEADDLKASLKANNGRALKTRDLPNPPGKDPLKNSEPRGELVWTPRLGKCRHCGKLGHLNKDCKDKDRIEAEKKAAKEKAASAEDGTAKIASEQGLSCDKEVTISEEFAKAFLASGAVNITSDHFDRELDQSQLLSALQTGQLADGRVLMVREQRDEDGESPPDEQGPSPTDFEDTRAWDAPGDPRPRSAASASHKFYVLPNGSKAGIYFGTWNLPHNIRANAEGVRAPPGLPTSRVCSTLEEAVNIAHTLIPDRGWKFMGPVIPVDDADWNDSFSVGTIIGPDLRAREPQASDQKASASIVTDQPKATAPDSAVAYKPSLDLDSCEPMVLPAQLRASLRSSFTELYRRSSDEGFSPPPNVLKFLDEPKGKLVKPAAFKIEKEITAFSERGPLDSIAEYTRIHAGKSCAGQRDSFPIRRGSDALKAALIAVRSDLTSALEFAVEANDSWTGIRVNGSDFQAISEDELIARVSIPLLPILTSASREAINSPIARICGVEVPSPAASLLKCTGLLKDPGEKHAELTTSEPNLPYDDSTESKSAELRESQAEEAKLGRGDHPSTSAASPRGGGGASPCNSTPTTPTRATPSQDSGRCLVSSDVRALRDRYLRIVVDSGCTHSSHPHREDLINFKPLTANMSGAVKGSSSKVVGVGDLPLLVRDASGALQRVILQNVRCVPSFDDTLISVSQQIRESGLRPDFISLQLTFPATKERDAVILPFSERRGLFELEAVKPTRDHVLDFDPGTALVAHHGARTNSHVAAMPADAAATAMHRRLLLPEAHLRKLPSLVADMPPNAATGHHAPSSFWIESNATKLPHAGRRYVPSHVGRQLHIDLAGPFKATTVGGFRYMLVCVDDHSRLKGVFFMRTKTSTETLACVQRFIARLRAVLNIAADAPTQVVSSIHSDGGGEFISREFSEFTDSEYIEHTTSPPGTSDLNGVAERAIRAIMEIVRAALVSSNAPIGFWNYAAEHAADILNRTTGPPESTKSSFELATGNQPKVMGIFPFGCRAYAVKQARYVYKTVLPAKADVGINLGKSAQQPSSYLVWLPHLSKVSSASDVWFDESLMPWRPQGDQRVGPVVPHAAPVETIGGSLHSNLMADASASRLKPPTAEGVSEDFHQAVASSVSPKSSKMVLILFSGPKKRPDGLAAYLKIAGFECTLIDFDPKNGGGPEDNILDDDVYARLMGDVKAGKFAAIFAAPPCSTFSVARHFESNGKDPGPPPIRSRSHIRELPDLPPSRKSEARRANEIVGRTCALLLTGWRMGTEFILENPADHGDPALPRLFLTEEHAPIWLMAEIKALSKLTQAGTVSFPQCELGAPWQKDTTLMFSPGLARWLDPLGGLVCSHKSHVKQVGGERNAQGDWVSAESAAYPPQLNLYLATALVRTITAPSLVATPAAGGVNSPAPRSRAPVADEQPSAPPLAVVSTTPLAPEAPVDIHVDEEPTGGRPSSEPIEAPADASSPVPDSPARAPDSPLPRPRKRRSPKPVETRGLGRFQTRSATASNGGVAMIASGAHDWLSRNEMVHKLLLAGVDAHACGKALRAAECNSDDAKLLTPVDPKNRPEAMRLDRVGWTKAEDKELGKHGDNQTYIEMDQSELPAGRRLVKLVWVYKVKRDGSLKARLCVQGCSQVAGVDYDQTHCSTLRSSSLRMLTAVAARFGLSLRRWDFASAYLQGVLEDGEVVYCSAPPGHATIGADGRPRICKVVKPIYGMAQAGRRWQRSLFPWLLEQGFTQLHVDKCLFMKRRTRSDGSEEILLIGCYVDDLACAYTELDGDCLYEEFTKSLKDRWEVEDEGEISDLLAIEFLTEEGSITLHQSAYIGRLVSEFGSDDAKPSAQGYTTPCDKMLAVHVAEALLARDHLNPPSSDLLREYQSLVGALLYCSVQTRPDIAFAMGLLCRCMSCPSEALLADARRVLRYLDLTRSLGLRYEANQAEMHGYSDSDWGTQHSTTGFVFLYSTAAISWGSSKQPSVSLSSCEAEIMAASEASKEAKHLRMFLDELGLGDPSPTTLAVDNTAARDLSYNPEHHKRVKHIERRHFFVRELVERNELRVPYVNTVDNIADFFTKPQEPRMFRAMRDVIMNVPPTSR